MKTIIPILLLLATAGCETVTKATYFAADGTSITFEKHTPIFVDPKVGHVALTTRPVGFTMDDFGQTVDPQATEIAKGVAAGVVAGIAAGAKVP